MARLGVNWGSAPDISAPMQSLGAALGSAMSGGGGGRAALTQSRLARDEAYIQSLQQRDALLQQKSEQDALNAQVKRAEDQQKIDMANQQNQRAMSAADSEWAAQDARIKPAGIGVLAPDAPAIVEYDTNSKALHDRLKMIYGAGGNASQMADGVNNAVGGTMVQQGSPDAYLRGNAMMGKPLDGKDLMPGGAGPVPINPDGSPAAKPAAAGKPTAENLKAAGFVPRLEDANRIMSDPKVAAASQNLKDRALDYVPVVGRFFQSEDFKRLSDAEKDMVTAVLRDESGATIQDSEFTRDADKYFPRYGDTPQIIAEKANRRRIQIESMRMKAGPALQGTAAPAPTGSVTPGPDRAALEAEAQAAIAKGADPAAVHARLQKLLGGQ